MQCLIAEGKTARERAKLRGTAAVAPPESALRCVRWNPSPGLERWIACGGHAGLLTIVEGDGAPSYEALYEAGLWRARGRPCKQAHDSRATQRAELSGGLSQDEEAIILEADAPRRRVSLPRQAHSAKAEAVTPAGVSAAGAAAGSCAGRKETIKT